MLRTKLQLLEQGRVGGNKDAGGLSPFQCTHAWGKRVSIRSASCGKEFSTAGGPGGGVVFGLEKATAPIKQPAQEEGCQLAAHSEKLFSLHQHSLTLLRWWCTSDYTIAQLRPLRGSIEP